MGILDNTHLVRTRSRGASSKAAIAEAATAMPNEANGEGLSATSRPPIAPATTSAGTDASEDGSGKSNRADNRFRVQPSTALTRTL